WCTGVYREIVEPERIVYSLAAADENGDLAEPAEMGMDPDWPRETIVTVTFAELGAGTQLTLHQTVSEALAKRTGAHPSWLQMLDRLENLLMEGAR
ncbi:MAG: SRPBCC domain-containing protein, partial [Thermoanaerobaculia bacterium]